MILAEKGLIGDIMIEGRSYRPIDVNTLCLQTVAVDPGWRDNSDRANRAIFVMYILCFHPRCYVIGVMSFDSVRSQRRQFAAQAT